MSPVLTRRSFLRTSATSSSALVLAFYLPRSGGLAAIVSAAQASFAPNAWLEVSSAGAINEKIVTVDVIADRRSSGNSIWRSCEA